MDTQQERLSHLDRALSNGENICSSEGMLCSFPASLKKPFMINGAGLMVCRQGNFTFSLNMKVFSAQAGETVFIPEDSLFQVLSESEDLQLFIFIYQIEPIRDIIGNSVATMYLYMQLRTEPCMEHRRRRRSPEIHVLTGQYPALRQQHLQRQRTKAASAGTHIPHLFHLQP